MIYINGEEVKPYLGDYKPLTIYKGTEKLAGWVENTTEISSNIRIENGYSTMKVKPFGKSEQKTSEQSANLCPNIDSDKWVLSGGAYKENGYIVLPQVGAKAEMVVEWNGQKPSENGKYLCFWGANFVTSDVENAKYLVETIYLNENKQTITSNGNSAFIGDTDIWKGPYFAYSEDTSYGQAIRDAKYIRYRITYSSTNTAPYKFKNPLISKTSSSTYVEFIPDSPSPNYPSKIENVSGDLEVKAIARNILPRTFAEDLLKRLNVSSTDNYLVEIDGKNYFKYPANLGYQTGKNYFTKDIFEESTQYVFKLAIMKNDSETSGKINIGIKYTDGTFESLGTSVWTNMTEKEVTIISDENKTIEEIGISYNSGITYINLDKYILCKLEAGMDTNKIEYEPYKEQIVTFPLGEQKLMKDGYLGESGIVNKRKQIVLTGNENWKTIETQNTENTFYIYTAYYDSIISKNDGSVLCNIAVRGDVFDVDEGNRVYKYNRGEALRFRFWKKDIADLESWKAYLAKQYANGTPVIVELVSAEEETTPYTEQQQTAYNNLQKLKTYRTVTNISNNQDTNMKIMYKINN